MRETPGMALALTHVTSDALLMSTSLAVVLPQTESVEPPPVLYLLHGLSDDDTAWVRRSSIERYAQDRGIAVVMPRVERSFYQDMAHGERYWTYVSEELPRIVRSLFRVSDRREDTFVAGLSMGGYGAMRLALLRPELFAAAASLSGALDMADPEMPRQRPDLYENAFGGREIAGTDADLHALLARATPADTPRLFVACGTEDDLWGMQQPFVDAARARGLDVTHLWSAGEHDWPYWDARIQDVLDWLPIRSRAGRRDEDAAGVS